MFVDIYHPWQYENLKTQSTEGESASTSKLSCYFKKNGPEDNHFIKLAVICVLKITHLGQVTFLNYFITFSVSKFGCACGEREKIDPSIAVFPSGSCPAIIFSMYDCVFLSIAVMIIFWQYKQTMGKWRKWKCSSLHSGQYNICLLSTFTVLGLSGVWKW